MGRRFSIAAVIVIGLGAIGLIWMAVQPPDSPNLEANIINAEDFEIPSIGFSRVDGSYAWEFPQDFAPHPTFQHEQWELKTVEDCEVGLEMVFARTSLLPENLSPDRSSEWAIRNIFNGTFKVIEDGESLIDATRSTREALELAGANENQVWVENWILDWENGLLVWADGEDEARLEISVGSPETPSQVEDWYVYEQYGEASGQLNIGKSTMVDCEIVLTHRFQ